MEAVLAIVWKTAAEKKRSALAPAKRLDAFCRKNFRLPLFSYSDAVSMAGHRHEGIATVHALTNNVLPILKHWS